MTRSSGAGRQRGPSAAHHTGKQKKIALQEGRRRARERGATADAEDAFEAALVEAAIRAPKVVQARCYTYREHRGAAVLVRVRLSIDRQLCAGFVPGRQHAADATTPEPAADASAQTPRATRAERRARDMALRARAYGKRLSETSRLKSLTEVEVQWTLAVGGCTRLINEVEAEISSAPAAMHRGHPWVFGLVQQALQTGPLAFGKPAQLKRMAKALDSRRGQQLEGALHPHAQTVFELLMAMSALAHACTMEGVASASGAAANQGPGEGDVTEAEGLHSPAATVAAPPGDGLADDGEGRMVAASSAEHSRITLSARQCEVIQQWLTEYKRNFFVPPSVGETAAVETS